VQGVGFRPFAVRLAQSLGLTGWICNDEQGVLLAIQGEESGLQAFLRELTEAPPASAFLQSTSVEEIPCEDEGGFTILPSQAQGEIEAWPPLDLATCDDCLHEYNDLQDRRFLYPLLNCTACGPRYTLLDGLPYDRHKTAMRGFSMCAACRREYEDPQDRRFHAQPTACPHCGPRVFYSSQSPSYPEAEGKDALEAAISALRRQEILALKGIGGFQLLVDASDEAAIQRLRERKRRKRKPLALLFPSLEIVRLFCEVSEAEAALLCSPANPIVLLRRRKTAIPKEANAYQPCEGIAADAPEWGVMLPTTPFHHALSKGSARVLVCSSANLSGVPLCAEESEAEERLAGVADGYLWHERPIFHPLDDAVFRVVADRPQCLRLGRGFAPLVIPESHAPHAALATGAQEKASVALADTRRVWHGAYLGDLDQLSALERWHREREALIEMSGITPTHLVCDLHPDYTSSLWAIEEASKTKRALHFVQHHHAHLLGTQAEHRCELPLLGLIWDGTGYGLDHTIWGGEAFWMDEKGIERLACFRPFPLIGGEAAIREIKRAALGLLYAIDPQRTLDQAWPLPTGFFDDARYRHLCALLAREMASPRCSSLGRLLDALAALLGLLDAPSYDGEAAILLEWQQADLSTLPEAYPLPLIEAPLPAGQMTRQSSRDPLLWWDSGALVHALLADQQQGIENKQIAGRVHHALIEAALALWRRYPCERIALSGGCFQNRTLLSELITRFRALGVEVFWPQRLPCNDGGLPLGQLAALKYPHLLLDTLPKKADESARRNVRVNPQEGVRG
jgi:hydrogenase maturation protein HypF